MKHYFPLLLILIYSVGCSGREDIHPMPSIDPEAKAQLAKPVNCATARQDIAILEDEKASVGKRMLKGVQSILPVGAVIGIVTADYSERVEVAIGTYNQDIEDKIVEIQTHCNIN